MLEHDKLHALQNSTRNLEIVSSADAMEREELAVRREDGGAETVRSAT